MRVKVLKESGESEEFNRRKLKDSLLSCRVGPGDADEIIDTILPALKPPVTTRKIYRQARKHLSRKDLPSTMRYSLKQAIYALGPTGYPFEKYIGRVLGEQGFSVEVGVLVPGHCVNHEVDIVARKNTVCFLVECKFHQNRRTTSDIKTALYVHARFLDVVKARGLSSSGTTHEGMLVTNTRFTSEAVKYADCVGLRALGWKHPEDGSLEQLIERGMTYPVTALPAVNRTVLAELAGKGLVLARDLLEKNAKELVRLTGLPPNVVSRLKAQSEQLCG